MKKIITIAAGMIAAAAVLTTPAAAYMTDLEKSTDSFISDTSQWKIVSEASENSPFSGASKIQAVITVVGDTDKYFRERGNGAYDDEDLEAQYAFSDFTGFLGLGARVSGDNVRNDWWLQFDYHGLSDSEGGSGAAEVTKLDDVTFLLTADLTGITIDGAAGNSSIAVADWGNKSPDYSLTVKEAYLYGADGSVVLYSDGEGNMTSSHDPFDITKYAAAEEPAAPATAAEEASPETTASEKPAETTAPSTAAAEENTTSEETAAGAPAETAAASTNTTKKDFGSRDSSLLIFGIVAGVIIVGAIVALLLIILKKKK